MEKLPIDNVHHTEGLRAEVFRTLDQKWLIVRTFDNKGWLKSITRVKYIDFGQGLRNRKDISIIPQGT